MNVVLNRVNIMVNAAIVSIVTRAFVTLRATEELIVRRVNHSASYS